MRLSKLAKELDVKMLILVDYLSRNTKIEIDNGPNTKLDEKTVNLLIKEFGKKEEVLAKKEETKKVIKATPQKVEAKKDTIETTVVPDKIDLSKFEKKKIEPEKPKPVQTGEMRSAEDIVVDLDAPLIKVEKINLEGPKVMGKIDLGKGKEAKENSLVENDAMLNSDLDVDPEFMARLEQTRKELAEKAKAEEEAKKEAERHAKIEKENRKKEEELRKIDERLAKKRKEEEKKQREAERKKESDRLMQKQLKKNHYIERMNTQKTEPPVKHKKKSKKQIQQEEVVQEQIRVEEVKKLNPLKRLWMWLNQ